MTVKQFIEAAIEGGWENKHVWWRQDNGEMILDLFCRSDLALMLLDVEAWEAVGITLDNRMTEQLQKDGIFASRERWPWEGYMTKMVLGLIAGKTLEEYITTL